MEFLPNIWLPNSHFSENWGSDFESHVALCLAFDWEMLGKTMCRDMDKIERVTMKPKGSHVTKISQKSSKPQTSRGKSELSLLYKNLKYLKAYQRKDNCEYLWQSDFPFKSISECRQAIRDSLTEEYKKSLDLHESTDRHECIDSTYGVNLMV